LVATKKERGRGSFLGLAVGDALGSPTEGKTPSEIFTKWGRVTDFLTPEQGGSDDTEYALFSAKLLTEKKEKLTAEDVAAAWRRDIITGQPSYKGAGFSEIIAMQNLLKGLNPPESGRHLHSWSDGLAMRAAPFGIAAAGNPALAARLAAIDGSISHSGEGIYSGMAVAAAVASAMNGDDVKKIFSAALSVIPNDSWTFSAINTGIEIGENSSDAWSVLERLHAEIACNYYFWTDLGPEALGLAFGLIAAAKGDFAETVTAAVNIGRDTDTIAAIAGAVCGAMAGINGIPQKWISRITVSRGICIRAVKGMNIMDMADELSELNLHEGGNL
jgi:ADP-ribosylglycohydrolase